jgi:hypothetical protein
MSERRDHLESIEQPTVHHEETDVNIRAIFGFAAGLLAVTTVLAAAVWGLFLYFDERETRASGPPSPLATSEPRRPPEPRLQVNPREEAAEFRAREDAVLNGYSWVNRETGTVRIPISEAMKLTLQRGLPVRSAPTEQPK